MVRRPSRFSRRVLALLLPALMLFLQAAVALPVLHHALHGGEERGPAHHCDEPGCVLVALASGAMEPGPGPVAVCPPPPRVSNVLFPVFAGFPRADCPTVPGRSPPR